MGKADRKVGWAWFWASLAGAALIGLLLASSDVLQWAITPILFFIGICLSLAAYFFRLLEAPFAIGRLPRALFVLGAIWLFVFALARYLGPRPVITFSDASVYLAAAPNTPIYVNVDVDNIGGKGTMTAYAYSGLIDISQQPSIARRELEAARAELVAKGNGLVFSIGAREKRYFTIFGPVLTDENTKKLRENKLAFYFSATIVTRPGSDKYEYCAYIVGWYPRPILNCPE